MIKEQPAFARLDRRRTGPDLRTLKPRPAAPHDVTVPAPVNQIGRCADENIAEGRVPSIRRTAEHEKFSVDLAREMHAVAIVREKRVLDMLEVYEIGRLRDPNGRSVITVAPCDVVYPIDQ